MVSHSEYAYHGHETPIIYADNTKLIDTLSCRVNRLFKQFQCCRSINNSLVSLYSYEFNNTIIWEILNTSLYPNVNELISLFDKESKQIIQEGVLAAWLTLDNKRFSKAILKQAGKLSYGLVLKHPIAIKRAASYLCGFTREEELESLIPTEIVQDSVELAIERVMERCPNESRSSILAALKNVHIL